MTPAGDCKDCQDSMDNSHYLTNIVPQDFNNNSEYVLLLKNTCTCIYMYTQVTCRCILHVYVLYTDMALSPFREIALHTNVTETIYMYTIALCIIQVYVHTHTCILYTCILYTCIL